MSEPSDICKKYLILKEKYPNVLFFFELGAFYNAISADALFMNKEFGWNFNDFSVTIKVGTQNKNFESCKAKLQQRNIEYKLITADILKTIPTNVTQEMVKTLVPKEKYITPKPKNEVAKSEAKAETSSTEPKQLEKENGSELKEDKSSYNNCNAQEKTIERMKLEIASEIIHLNKEVLCFIK
jgi:hypothetical protein